MPYGELFGGSCTLETGPNEHEAWMPHAGVHRNEIFDPDDGVTSTLNWFGSYRANDRDEDHRMIVMATCLLPDETDDVCARNPWISHEVVRSAVGPGDGLDLRAACSTGTLFSGGCSADTIPDNDLSLMRSGFAPDNRDEWLCSFQSLHETVTYEVATMAFCLNEDPLPAECGCCPPLAEQLTIRQTNEPLRNGPNRLEASCEDDEFLLIGNCMLDVPAVSEVESVTMFRYGYPPTDEHPDGDYSRWGCSWHNPTGYTPRALANAVCLPAQ
ncbi:hypothetical protein Hoch_0184 [Haliangium ochraceum DSM 14365]|uniref:Uncharacterized protein n=2 Tax=Haliangium ochraceum TaxID=80816 RepID=D0LHG3_HALO1|nr:hypothetical protein Hoch_0184 [Haliangium ochraceum DSM 14365]